MNDLTHLPLRLSQQLVPLQHRRDRSSLALAHMHVAILSELRHMAHAVAQKLEQAPLGRFETSDLENVRSSLEASQARIARWLGELNECSGKEMRIGTSQNGEEAMKLRNADTGRMPDNARTTSFLQRPRTGRRVTFVE